jgi:hypothetical protein
MNDILKYINTQLKYNPKTGFIFWKIPGPGRKLNKPAGWIKEGYIRIGLSGKQLYAHRIAWIISTGEWPKNDIDHINMIKSDNRLINLREATRTENTRNNKICKRNTSGVTGVHYYKSRKVWQVYVRVNNRNKHIGYFSKLLDAKKARISAEKKYYGVFASKKY